MNTIRSFICIDIDPDVKRQVKDLTHKISSNRFIYSPSGIKWVKPENLHITLAFLGNVYEDKIPLLTSVIETVAKSQPSFDVNLTGLGFFPNFSSPKVFWIGIDKSHPLLNLKKQLDYSLQQAGISFDKKPFSPHLTIARFKSPVEIKKEINNIAFHAAFSANEIHLVKSELLKSGAVYTKIYSTPLKKL